MAWIESHQSLARHPKLNRLARTLKTNKAQAIGHLHLFWWWTLDYASQGDVSAFASHELAQAAEWTGDAERFTAALRDCGFIDPDGTVHDWCSYAGRMIQMRERNADRQRKYREKHHEKEETGRNSDSNSDITVTSPLRNGATQPNLTKPVLEREREDPDCAHRPSEKEVIAYAAIIGLAEWRAIDWWREMEGCGWLDHQRRPIARWQPILARVRAKWEADGRPISPPSRKAAPNGTANGGRPPSVMDLKSIIAVNQEKADKLKGQFCSESALGSVWTRNDKLDEYREIRGKIKKLNEQIAALG